MSDNDLQLKVGRQFLVAGDNSVWRATNIFEDKSDPIELQDTVQLIDGLGRTIRVLSSMLSPTPDSTSEAPACFDYQGIHYRRSERQPECACPRQVIDPNDKTQIHDAGLCRIEEAHGIIEAESARSKRVHNGGWLDYDQLMYAFNKHFGGNA